MTTVDPDHEAENVQNLLQEGIDGIEELRRELTQMLEEATLKVTQPIFRKSIAAFETKVTEWLETLAKRDMEITQHVEANIKRVKDSIDQLIDSLNRVSSKTTDMGEKLRGDMQELRKMLQLLQERIKDLSSAIDRSKEDTHNIILTVSNALEVESGKQQRQIEAFEVETNRQLRRMWILLYVLLALVFLTCTEVGYLLYVK